MIRRSKLSEIVVNSILADLERHVEGMWMIEPDDYVLTNGEKHTVREFVERAFAEVRRGIVWRGKGREEKGLDARSGRVLVAIDPRYFRPTEVDSLVGDASKAGHEPA
jgi:GDPmannose 4,6-dehydratase